MIVDHTSLCFINVHLAAGQSQKAARNADLVGIMEDKAIFPEQDLLPFVHGGDGTGILDHEMVILNGDLNVGRPAVRWPARAGYGIARADATPVSY